MEKYSVMIVDDEPLARDNLRILLERDLEIEVVAICSNGPEAKTEIPKLSPDILFLDVQMPKMNGFEVLKSLDASAIPVVVFVTAYDEYAVKAFEVDAIDYLLKPFSDERFKTALERAKRCIEQNRIRDHALKLMQLLDKRTSGAEDRKPESVKETAYPNRIALKSIGKIRFLQVDDIDWIEAESNYIRIHAKEKEHLLRESLGEIETKLDPARFLRIHRSTIVNKDRIDELHPYFRGEYIVVLRDGTRLKMSRSQRDKLQFLLNGLP